jgi:hypothetical protein
MELSGHRVSFFENETGQVVIENYDTANKTISGTFSGNARNRTGKVVAITGRFAACRLTPH